jgi:hypothetical protein
MPSRRLVVLVVWAVCALAAPTRAQETPQPPASKPETGVEGPSSRSTEPEPATPAERIEKLEQKVKELSDEMESESLERVVQEAEAEARAAETEESPEERTFLDGSRALQRLNPEVTFNGDILATMVANGSKFYATEGDRSTLAPRAVGLHIQHVLDPYSLFKSAFEFSPEDGVEVEEVYVSWFGLTPSVSFSVGRFRQNFGILNRWHEHDLDQTEHPLAMRLVLGDDGLVGNGLSVHWMMPRLWAHANTLTLEVVDGDNPLLFSGEHFTRPSALAHLKNYYDLSPSTYLELGLTGMLGFNNRRGVPGPDGDLIDEPWRRTLLAGADLTLSWQPLERARYRSVTWRTEAYLADRRLPAEEAEGNRGRSWGVYSYLQSQLSARVFVGLRGDLALPTERDSSERTWGLTPYLTFWQSEFVYLRLEYQHVRDMPYAGSDGGPGRRTDNRLLLQIDFAAGPHKHEKY